MPANLTPQYKEAEQRYRQARTLPAKVAALQEMMAVIPKHKGTDHMRADLRARMSRHMEELEKPKSTSGGPQPFSIRKEGAGQVLIVGLPNAGKSEILNALTRAPAKVGDYPFTTQIPMVGMLPFENVLFQLVDTPALNALDVQTRLFGLLRNTDLLLVTVNLEGDPLKEMDQINGLLHQWGYSLLEEGEAIDPRVPGFRSCQSSSATRPTRTAQRRSFRSWSGSTVGSSLLSSYRAWTAQGWTTLAVRRSCI